MMVAAAVLGMVAGATACGAARNDMKGAQPSPSASSAAAGSDKSACGNHPGSSCAAVSPPK
jgi:hypothetical protein